MNARQKLHKANLAKWTALFQEQASSGLTIKDWCAQNNISIHTYNYWKHAVKEAYVDSLLPDIVPIAPGPLTSSPLEPPIPRQPEALGLHNSCDSRNSLDSCNLMDSGCVSIVIGDIRIEIGPSVSDEMVSGIIQAVRHV